MDYPNELEYCRAPKNGAPKNDQARTAPSTAYTVTTVHRLEKFPIVQRHVNLNLNHSEETVLEFES